MLLIEDEVKRPEKDVVISLRKHPSGVIDVITVYQQGGVTVSGESPILRFYPNGRIQRLKSHGTFFKRDAQNRAIIG